MMLVMEAWVGVPQRVRIFIGWRVLIPSYFTINIHWCAATVAQSLQSRLPLKFHFDS